MIIVASEKGIEIGKDVTAELNTLLQEIRDIKGEKTILLDGGEYFLSSKNATKRKLFITNTIGDKEWKDGEVQHLNIIGINFENIENLIIEGNGSVFTIDGQMSNVVISNCENIILKDIAFRTINPDLHELKVIKKGLTYVDFELDKESEYTSQNNKLFFTGQDYIKPFNEYCATAYWIGNIKENDLDSIKRISHPFMGAHKIKEIAPYKFRASYIFKKKFDMGERFYLFDSRRKFVGIFIEKSKNIGLNNIKQHFNYSLAVVCQDSENLSIKNCDFVPEEDSSKLMISIADFIQICMCRGDVDISHNTFVGAGDDCLNVHGIHFVISAVENNTITVKFAHPQSHGFNPLRVGDKIKFVNKITLLGDKYAKIEKSEMLDEYSIKLILDNTSDAKVGYVIEDVDACPNLYFGHNTLSRIITRGILVTTSGKVVIENNRFESTSMHSILISDDAKNWYESGNVTNVSIRENYFGICPMYNIFIKPENICHEGYVHSNINISDNVFDSEKHGGIFIKSSDQVVIKHNTFKTKKRIKFVNSNLEQYD